MNEYGYSQGLAMNASQSAYPGLWRGLIAAFAPSAGIQGSSLVNFAKTSQIPNASLISSPTYVAGMRASALRLNGSSQYLNCGLNVGPQNGYTAMLWISPTSATGTYATVHYYSAIPAYSQFFTFSGNVTARIHQTRDVIYIGRRTTGGLTADKWTHLAFTWSGGTTNAAIAIYINGIRADTTDDGLGSFTAPNASPSSLYIGAQGGASPTAYLAGKLDDVRIYNRALSAQEIMQSYMGASPLVPLSPYILAKAPSVATGFGPLLSFQRNYLIAS